MDFRKRYVYNPKQDLLGKGGFSRVFKATDVLLEREVALKVFNPEQSAQYDLITEIKKVIKFQQENLCSYYDVAILENVNAFGEDEQVQVGVMEYLDGGELKGYLKKNPQYLNKLLCDVLRGLSYLHKRSIIHRDLKPQNILIKIEDDGPVAKITDFGISKALGAAQENASALVGTVEYMAPEQFNPAKYGIDGKISTHIDLWSFGIMVYELIVGVNLFGSRSKGTSAEIVMTNILNEDYVDKLAGLPPPYNEVVTLCLKKRAAERAASADVLLAILSSHVTDSTNFAGLTGKVKTPQFDDGDETTLLQPANNTADDDGETQLISYSLPDVPMETQVLESAPVSKPAPQAPKPPEPKTIEKPQVKAVEVPKPVAKTPEPPKPVEQPKPVVAEPKAAPVEAKKPEPAKPVEQPKPQPVADKPVTPVVKTPEPVKQEAKPAPVEPKKPAEPVQQKPEVKAAPVAAKPDAPKPVESKQEPAKPVEQPKPQQAAQKPATPAPQVAGETTTRNEALAASLADAKNEAKAQVASTIAKPAAQKKPLPMVAIIAVVAVVIIAAVFFMLKGGDDKPAEQPLVKAPAASTENSENTNVAKPATEKAVASKPAKTGTKTAPAAKATGASTTVTNQTFTTAGKEYTYTGKVKNGLPEGSGVQKFSDGSTYTGGLSAGLASGRGTMTWASGDKYVGNWAAGKRTTGTYYYNDGSMYKGSFKNGLKTGHGKFMYRDGSYYEGNFANDEFNGQGKLYNSDGELTQSGTFKNGSIQN